MGKRFWSGLGLAMLVDLSLILLGAYDNMYWLVEMVYSFLILGGAQLLVHYYDK